MSLLKPLHIDLVFRYITDHQDELVTHASVGKALKMSQSSAASCLYRLVDQGKIELVESRGGPGSGSVYRVVQ